MGKANFKQQMIDIAKKFKWYEVLYLTLGLIAVVALSIIAKSSAITISYSIFGVLYVGAIAKQLKIGLIFGLLQATLYIVQSALYNNWGEFILNIAIVLPLIVLSIVGWFRKSSGVTVTSKKLSRNEWIILTIINLAVSIAFYFVLALFDAGKHKRLLHDFGALFDGQKKSVYVCWIYWCQYNHISHLAVAYH